VARADGRPGFFAELFTGVGILGQGLRVWGTAPRLMLIGVIPAIIVAAVYLAAIIVFAMNLEAIAAWATPFADTWDETLRTAFRLVVVVAFFILAIQLVIYTYTAITLAVGDAFYERIWRHVETTLGNVPADPEIGFWRSVRRAIGDALRILVPSVFFGLLLFACGLIPVIGQVTAVTLGALVGGWFLTIELTGRAFEIRGLTLKQRRRMLARRRPMTLGFGLATWLLFLIPGGAVIVMPAAVAGATILSRRVLDEAAASSAAAAVVPAQ